MSDELAEGLQQALFAGLRGLTSNVRCSRKLLSKVTAQETQSKVLLREGVSLAPLGNAGHHPVEFGPQLCQFK